MHYYLGGGANVPGVPGTHQICQFNALLFCGWRGGSRQFSNWGRTQWSLLLGSIMTWVEVLTYRAYPVVIITWFHYYLGGGADVPSGHYYLGGGVDGANKNIMY